MPRAAPIQSNFSAGEISPLVQGRTDFDAYKRGVGLCRNWITTLQGPVIRRPGTQWVANVADSTKATRLVKFVFSGTQSYVLEFGHQTIRFYTQESQILFGGVPYQIATPYLSTDLFSLQFAQSNDVLYIVHPSYQPMSLNRFGNTNWTLTNLSFVNGPYGLQNVSSTTLQASAVSGSITITASAATFASTDVGRWVQINVTGSSWGWAQITAFTNSTHVTATTASNFGGTGASTEWALGLWSNTTGWPATVCFHQGRLCFGGSTADPVRVDMSASQAYLDFTPFPANGNPTDSNAVSFDILSTEVNQVLWIKSNSQGLQIGTLEGEWLASGSGGSGGNGITPSSLNVQSQSSFGSSPSVAPVQVGRATLYAQRAGRKIREMYYQYILQGFDSQDITVLSEHITSSGIKEMAFQEEPIPILWAVRNDGTLIGCTYEHDIQQLRVGWHQHVIGGISSLGGDAAVVESVTVIPTITAFPFAGNSQDEVWLVVRRLIGGVQVRSVEYMAPYFNQGQFTLAVAANQLDSAIRIPFGHYIVNVLDASGDVNVPGGNTLVQLDGPVTLAAGTVATIDGVFGSTYLNGKSFTIDSILSLSINGVTKAASAVVSGTSVNGYVPAVGDSLLVSGVSGMTQLNGNTYTVSHVSLALGVYSVTLNVDSTGFGSYTSGGSATSQYITLQDSHGAVLQQQQATLSTFKTGPNGIPGVSATGVFAPHVSTIGPFPALVLGNSSSPQPISVFGDGGRQVQTPDASGNITVSPAAGFVVAGFPFNSDLQLLRFDNGAGDGTRMGKTVRTHRASLLVYSSLDLQVGFDGFDTNNDGTPKLHLPDEMKRQAGGATGVGPPMYSGMVTFNTEADSNKDNLLCIRASGPFPATIQAVMPMMDTQDRS